MRIRRLEVEGFGPFRERQEVDFDAFADDGIFLISGRTGAGKSSILDAVCFALYGNVPRYEEGEKRLRSDHSEPGEPTLVSAEFDTGGSTWRIERSPEYDRPKRSGTGMTTQAPEARIFELVDGEWQGRAARPRDVGQLLDEILGLNQQQFLQVILLAQNRFARFLLAKNDERQALLRTLFGTRRFEEYERAFDARRKDAEQGLERGIHELHTYLEQAEARVTDLTEAEEARGERVGGGAATDAGEDDAGVDDGPTDDAASEADDGARVAAVAEAALRARHAVEIATAEETAAEAARAAAEKNHAELTAQRDHQRRRDEARANLADLEARAAQIAEAREELTSAIDAESLRSAMDAATRAEAAAAEAEARESRLRAAWIDAGETTEGAEELAELITTLHRQRGEWVAGLDAERKLPEAELERDRLATEVAQLDERRVAKRAEIEAAPATIADTETELAATAKDAATEPAARARVDDLEAQLTAARDAHTLTEAARAAERAALDASKAQRAASAHLDDLRERRLAGFAGELAATLHPGDACAVCGSTEHPSPAPRGDDPVTPEAIEAAAAAKDAATEAAREAEAAARTAERTASEATARAGGKTAGDLEVALTDARAVHTTATEAVARETALTAQRDAQRAELEAARSALTTLDEQHAAAATALAAATERADALRAAAAAARGDHDTVAARIADADRRVGAAEALAEAARTTAQRRDAASVAAEDLATRLADSPFDDEPAVRAALRDADARKTLDARVREYDADLTAVKSTLMQLELEVLPEEPLDTAASDAALTTARSAWQAAVTARAEADQLAKALIAAAENAEIAHERIAARAAEVAVIERLAHTVSGRPPNTMRMKLETFVLAAELEDIVEAANTRLAEMSEGRYSLQHTDALAARGASSGLGLDVMDRFTGQPRPPHSLSGGETFLASLALALGLAEVVTSRAGGITLDTLFIDEGFGALDAETLDVAMRTLDELRLGGRTVGVISHVEAMKDQLPAQLLVEATPEGWSTVRRA